MINWRPELRIKKYRVIASFDEIQILASELLDKSLGEKRNKEEIALRPTTPPHELQRTGSIRTVVLFSVTEWHRSLHHIRVAPPENKTE